MGNCRILLWIYQCGIELSPFANVLRRRDWSDRRGPLSSANEDKRRGRVIICATCAFMEICAGRSNLYSFPLIRTLLCFPSGFRRFRKILFFRCYFSCFSLSFFTSLFPEFCESHSSLFDKLWPDSSFFLLRRKTASETSRAQSQFEFHSYLADRADVLHQRDCLVLRIRCICIGEVLLHEKTWWNRS